MSEYCAFTAGLGNLSSELRKLLDEVIIQSTAVGYNSAKSVPLWTGRNEYNEEHDRAKLRQDKAIYALVDYLSRRAG